MANITRLSLKEIHILESCWIVEEKCAHIYRHFAKIFANDPVVAELWNKIAKEEDHHADQFRLAACHLGTGIKDVKVNDRKVKSIIAKLEKIHEEIRTCHPTLAEAFELALYIEKSLAEYHIGSILTFADNELSKLFKKMELQDQGHLKMLQDAVEEIDAIEALK